MAWYDQPVTSVAAGATTGGGSSGNLLGSGYDYSPTYGGKAEVPDPTKTASSAITGTTSNLEDLYSLGSNVNQYTTSETLKAQEQLTPGYSANMEKWASDISDLLSGKVSSGTIGTIEQVAAERGISSGIAGSQANQSSLLRALGLTAEGQQQTGAAQMSAMLGSAPKVSLFDYTPYTTGAADQQSAQYAANLMSSAAVPAQSAAAQIDAAKSGVATGQSAAGAAPATTTSNSIGQLLASILGTGTGGGSAGGGVGFDTRSGTNPTNTQSFDDWYNQVYGSGGGAGGWNDYTGDQSFGAGTYGTEDTSAPADTGAYA